MGACKIDVIAKGHTNPIGRRVNHNLYGRKQLCSCFDRHILDPQGFLFILSALSCCCLPPCCPAPTPCGFSPEGPTNPLCLARGFNGDSTFRGGALTAAEEGKTSPVTFRRIGGRKAEEGPCSCCCCCLLAPEADTSPPPPPPPDFSENPEKEAVSGTLAPNACRRAFSCFAWTDRKWRSSSCHLISSRPNLDRVARGLAEDLGAICKNPAELTAFNRFRRDTKAELCGRSINNP